MLRSSASISRRSSSRNTSVARRMFPRRYGSVVTTSSRCSRARPCTMRRRLPSGSLNILWMWVAVPIVNRSACWGSSTAASRCVKTAISLPPDRASSIRRTELSRATASGMNECGKRTVSRKGRIGSSGGKDRTASPPATSSNGDLSGMSLTCNPFRQGLTRRPCAVGIKKGRVPDRIPAARLKDAALSRRCQRRVRRKRTAAT